MALSYFDNESINFTENLDFFAKQVVEGFLTGLHKSPFHGFSVEFAEHRMYNNGDSIKNIDWKLFARSDKLFVKRYEEETNLRCHLVIDSSSSMNFPIHSKNNKLNFSLFSSACLMNLFRRQRDAFGVTLFSDKINFHSEARLSKKHYFRLLHELEKKILDKEKVNQKTLFSSVLNEFTQRISKRSLVIIFSDLQGNQDEIDELFNSLKQLKHKKNEIILFHVQEFDKEKELNYKNKFFNFIDLETNDEVKINPYLYKNEYEQSQIKLHDLIKLKCAKYKIDYFSTDINKGYKNVLKSYLIKRSKLF
ncbi:MAG: hypothetical protein CBC73_02740 [Flavobacteriales bacterium TMED113]|nr:MAG: hypothetical protein CBC73_02740 [Flavobacteriales bacterium TMED113]